MSPDGSTIEYDQKSEVFVERVTENALHAAGALCNLEFALRRSP